uniref:Uncharacterized protein n=1 Tax=viral metagenome TaxID=1070528 RepID=A0A6M3XVJ6_9ZZZZ
MRTIYSSCSCTPLEIKGTWVLQGPQPINDEGGAPTWIAKAFKKNSTIKQIAVCREKGGIVYSRISTGGE